MPQVENWFAASFLIKEDKLRVEMDPRKNIPMVVSTGVLKEMQDGHFYQGPSQIVSDNVTNDQTEHCVVSFNMHDWQKLCKAIEPDGTWEAQIERSDTEDEEESEEEEEESEEEEEDDDDDEEEEESD